MKIAVIGASGACGRQLVTRALALGHTVSSVVRDSSELPETPGVRVFRGDLTDASFLAEALDGSDAALSALGFRIGGIAPWHKPPDPAFLEDSAKAIVAAAGKAGVGRLMAISSGGVGDSWDIVPAAFRFFVPLDAAAAADDDEKDDEGSRMNSRHVRPSVVVMTTGLVGSPS